MSRCGVWCVSEKLSDPSVHEDDRIDGKSQDEEEQGSGDQLQVLARAEKA